MFSFNLFRSERFLRLSKEGLWVILGQAMAVVGSVVGVRLLTELLDPVAYGELALGITVATLINKTVLGPLKNGIIRFYAPAQEQNDLGGYLNAVRRLVISATGTSFIILLFIIIALLIVGSTEWIVIASAALIFAVFSGYNSILSGIQNAARQRSIVAVHQGMVSWARFLVAAGLLLWLGATSTVAMTGYAVAILMVLGSQYIFSRKLLQQDVPAANKEKNWRKEICKYSWPFAFWGVFTWAQQVSDRWALELFTTTEEVGQYAVLFQLGYYPMSLATGMAIQFIAPIFYQRSGDASDSRRNDRVNSLSWRLAWLTIALTIAAFLIALLFHKHIFQVFVAKEYMYVSNLLPWMLLAGGLFAAGQTVTLNLTSLMKTQDMATVKIITAILGIILNFAGAYYYGIAGIVFATVVYSVANFLWMAGLSRKIAYGSTL